MERTIDRTALCERVVALLQDDLDREDAMFAVEHVLDSALEADERSNPLASLIADIERWRERGRPQPAIAAERPGCCDYDFNGAPAQLFLHRVWRGAFRAVGETGIAAVGLRNTGGLHELRTWVRPGVAQGLVSLFFWNGGSYTVVPDGSSEPFFGTNPMAYAVPASPPVVADFATSEIPFMDLMRAIREKQPLPDLAGLDEEGRATNDPSKVYDSDADTDVHLRPMGGGHKGSAIMLLTEILTGALVGAVMGREATDDPFTAEEFGGLLIVLDPRSFGVEDFQARVDRLTSYIRASKPAPGQDLVLLPGDRARARVAERTAAGGLLIDEGLEDRIAALEAG
jgi:LDH2 family malate/lactate/ureidoglycolate dehydrogenase